VICITQTDFSLFGCPILKVKFTNFKDETAPPKDYTSKVFNTTNAFVFTRTLAGKEKYRPITGFDTSPGNLGCLAYPNS